MKTNLAMSKKKIIISRTLGLRSRKDIVCEDSGLLETTPVNDYIIAGFSARCVEERPQSTAAECAAATADEKARNAAEGELSDSEAADEATAAALALQQREEATCALGDEEALRSAVAARVYVANLSYDSTEASIRARCALYGPITALSVPPSRDGRGGKLAGYAVVSYSKLADAEQAARRMDGARIDGRIVKARLEDLSRTASAKKRKHEGAGRYFGAQHYITNTGARSLHLFSLSLSRLEGWTRDETRL